MRPGTTSWPSPPLGLTPVALPYCDNLTVWGTDELRVNGLLQSLLEAFQKLGFDLHEITWATQHHETLGRAFLGDAHCIRPRPERVWTLRGALRAVASGEKVTGKTLEKLMGHYVVEALDQREALSVPRAVYTFIKDSYWTSQRVWESVARELYVCAGFLPLIKGDFGRP